MDVHKMTLVSNAKLYPSYLKSWAVYIAKELFTTSPEEIEKQQAEIQKISASSRVKSFFY
jgi:conjugal transfer pilus assembly protein TraE